MYGIISLFLVQKLWFIPQNSSQVSFLQGRLFWLSQIIVDTQLCSTTYFFITNSTMKWNCTFVPLFQLFTCAYHAIPKLTSLKQHFRKNFFHNFLGQLGSARQFYFIGVVTADWGHSRSSVPLGAHLEPGHQGWPLIGQVLSPLAGLSLSSLSRAPLQHGSLPPSCLTC